MVQKHMVDNPTAWCNEHEIEVKMKLDCMYAFAFYT